MISSNTVNISLNSLISLWGSRLDEILVKPTISEKYTVTLSKLSGSENIENKGIKEMTLVVNDFKVKRNDYGYHYQLNYYTNNDHTPKRLKSVFRKKRKR